MLRHGRHCDGGECVANAGTYAYIHTHACTYTHAEFHPHPGSGCYNQFGD
jgi:hypothetical protein